MNCPHCGADSVVTAVVEKPAEHRVVLFRTCDNDHKFVTTEVHLSQLADKRELDCAIRTIDRKVALFRRNCAILDDVRPLKEVAAAHGLTEARVRQIRAAAEYLPTARARAKILSSNSERKT